MRKIAQFGKYIRSLAIPPWTCFTVLWVLRDSNQYVIALKIRGPSSHQRGRLTLRRNKVIVTEEH
jgi:hypothetical protein